VSEERNEPFEGLIDALAQCPRCHQIHPFKVNPNYAPAIQGPIPGRRNSRFAARNLSIRERAEGFYFRVICDKCHLATCPPQMRKQLLKKGWCG
jgi:hypothetical protein